jgi:hypothetical protein
MIMLRYTVYCTLLIQQVKYEDHESIDKNNAAYNVVQLGADRAYNKKENNFGQNGGHRKQLECRVASHEVCHG